MIINMTGGGSGVGGVLTVTAPAGVTVEVSKDGKTKRKTATEEGLAIFKGLATGTWTLTITNGVQTSTKPVVITADYSTVIAFFAATINITYPSGSICTCTDGTTTLTAPDTSGTWVCSVPNVGTWTVTITNGTETKSYPVSITQDGQTENVTLSYITYYFKSGEGAKISFSYAKETNASVSVSNERVSGSASSAHGGGWYYQSDKKVDLAEKTELVFNAKCTFAHTDQDWKPILFVSEKPISGKVQPPERLGTVYAKAALTADSVQREYVIPVAELNDSYHIGYFGAGSAVIYDIFAR